MSIALALLAGAHGAQVANDMLEHCAPPRFRLENWYVVINPRSGLEIHGHQYEHCRRGTILWDGEIVEIVPSGLLAVIAAADIGSAGNLHTIVLGTPRSGS